MSIAIPASIDIVNVRIAFRAQSIDHTPLYGGNRRSLILAEPKIYGSLDLAPRDADSANDELLDLLACMSDPNEVFLIPHHLQTGATDDHATTAVTVAATDNLTLSASNIAARFGAPGVYLVKAANSTDAVKNRLMLVTVGVGSATASIGPSLSIDATRSLHIFMASRIPAHIVSPETLSYQHTRGISEVLTINFVEAINQV